MADLVVTPDAVAYKRRNPWGVFLLAIVTLGVYAIVWYYKLNNELRNAGVRNDPLVATLAVTLGSALFVPPFVSYYRCAARIETAQQTSGAVERISPVLGLALTVFVGPFALPYYQTQANKAWDALAAAGAEVRPA